MIVQGLDEFQKTLYLQLCWTVFGGISAVQCHQYEGSMSINFVLSKDYFGTFYPLRAVMKDKGFTRIYDVEKIINMYPGYRRFHINKDVCESCKKIKYYPNVYLLTLKCDINDIKTRGKKMFFVFCKHNSIINFLKYDYTMFCDSSSSESSSSDEEY